ncbi:hypothetical protein CYMTET_53033, partial [Cymbomonas tetramitiformis]
MEKEASTTFELVSYTAHWEMYKRDKGIKEKGHGGSGGGGSSSWSTGGAGGSRYSKKPRVSDAEQPEASVARPDKPGKRREGEIVVEPEEEREDGAAMASGDQEPEPAAIVRGAMARGLSGTGTTEEERARFQQEAQGVPCVGYLDDFFMVARTAAEAQEMMDLMIEFVTMLGFKAVGVDVGEELLEELAVAVERYQDGAYAESTQRSYDTGVKAFLTFCGVRRQWDRPAKPVMPITLRDLARMAEFADMESITGLALWAAILVGFYGLFRKDNLTVGKSQAWNARALVAGLKSLAVQVGLDPAR